MNWMTRFHGWMQRQRDHHQRVSYARWILEAWELGQVSADEVAEVLSLYRPRSAR